MVLVAFDDTDSVQGGCTTHLASRAVAMLPPGLDLIGPPRLVRLNPNAPHRTRGNGAVALRLGAGTGPVRPGGMVDGRPVHWFEAGDPADPRLVAAFAQRLARLIDGSARLDDARTNPGLVVAPRPPPSGFYDAAVHRLVGAQAAHDALAAVGGRAWTWKNGRGMRGAVAAAAWPGERVTYEAIAYRDPVRVGTHRDLDPGIGAELDARHPSTFDNWDPETGHLRIAPASPCPVLSGIRATDPHEALAATGRVGPEPPADVLMFATNQASNDHRRATSAATLAPFRTATVTGRVARDPAVWRGGHVVVRLEDPSGPLDVVAYAATGGLAKALRRVRTGDGLRAHGGVRDDPTLLAIEAFDVLDAPPRRVRRAPRCAPCGRSMKSRGAGGAYRCARCRRRDVVQWDADDAPAPAGAWEAPVRVRRHLSRPLVLDPAAAGAEPSPGNV